MKIDSLLRLPVGRGGVINSPRSIFLGFFRCQNLGCRSWVIPLATSCMSPFNTAFNGGICQQNMYFNMYTTKSKPQEGSTCKDSHAKFFYNDKFHREALARGDERGEL